MKNLTILVAIIWAAMAHAQTFRLDSTFGNNGKIVSQNLRDLKQIIKKPDGKILAVGRKIPLPARIGVEQYLPNGVIDSSFGVNGLAVIGFNGGEDAGYSIGLQSNGKIIVGGSCQKSSSNTSLDFALARLNANGTIDSTFATNGRFTYDNNNYGFDKVAHLIIQPDDKILFAGGAGSSNILARLTANGDFDSTFGTNGIYSGGREVWRMILTSDGKIYTVTTGGLNANVRKFTSTGVFDSSFLSGNSYSESVVFAPQKADILLLNSGKLLLHVQGVMGTIFTLLNSDGTVDSATFGKIYPDSMGYSSKITFNTLFELAQGKILTPGFYSVSSSNQLFCISRFDMSTKRVDPAFTDSGYFNTLTHQPSATTKNEYLNCVITAQDGNLLFAGNSCAGSCIPVIYKFINDVGINPPTGITYEMQGLLNASVFPNPANGSVNIDLPAAHQATLNLTNIQGRIVLKANLQNGHNRIALDGLSPGMYFYTIVDAKGQSAKGKLMVH